MKVFWKNEKVSALIQTTKMYNHNSTFVVQCIYKSYLFEKNEDTHQINQIDQIHTFEIP